MSFDGIPKVGYFGSHVYESTANHTSGSSGAIEKLKEEERVSKEIYKHVVDRDKKSHLLNLQNKHTVALFAAVTVVVIAIIITVLAISLITGVAQTIVISISLAGLGIGLSKALSSIVNIYRERALISSDPEKKSLHAIKLGTGFLSLGFILRLGAHFIPGGYSKIVNSMGSSVYSLGQKSSFANFCHFLYLKFCQSEKVKQGLPLTREESFKEAKKLAMIARLTSIMGISFVAIGSILIAAGFLWFSGPAVGVALILAPPLVSYGVTILLQTLLHSSIAYWQAFIKMKDKTDLILDTVKPATIDQHFSLSEEIDFINNEVNMDNRLISPEDKLIDRTKVDVRKKIVLFLASLLMIASLAVSLCSGVIGLSNWAIVLLSGVTSATFATTLPYVTNGIAYNSLMLKVRKYLSKLKFKKAKEEIISYQDDSINIENKEDIENQVDHAWQDIKSNKIKMFDSIVKEDLKNITKHNITRAFIISGILIALGLILILLILIPGIGGFAPGLLGLGGGLMLAGGTALLKEFIDWLYSRLEKLREKAVAIQDCKSDVQEQFDIHAGDIILSLDQQESVA